MASTILQKNVRKTRIVSLDQKSAQALSDSVRMSIMEVLNHRPMSAEELTRMLVGMGHKKAVTTIRHHLDALKTAGLIEVTRLVEVRGAVLKYYSPTVRAFSFELPAGFEANHARLIQDTSGKIQKILKGIVGDKKFSAAFEKGTAICPVCKGSHTQEHAAAEVMNQALVRAMEAHVEDASSSEKEPKAPNKKT